MANINPQNSSYIPQAELRAQGQLDNALKLDDDDSTVNIVEYALGEIENGSSSDQLQEAMELFQLTDVTGDGLLDKTELTALQMQVDFDRDGAISTTDVGMFGRLLNMAPQIVQSNIATNHQFLVTQTDEPATSPQVQAMTDATMNLVNNLGGVDGPQAELIFSRVLAFLDQMGVPPQELLPNDNSLSNEENFSNQVSHVLTVAVNHFGRAESPNSQAFMARYYGFVEGLTQ